MKIKALITSFILLFAITATQAQDAKINFYHDNLDEAQKIAKVTNKPIFIDGYTDWCYYCKKMDKKTFSDPAVIKYMNENYINVKINMEKGDGPALAKQYKITGFPTMLILTSEGTYEKKIIGYKNPADFLNAIKLQ